MNYYRSSRLMFHRSGSAVNNDRGHRMTAQLRSYGDDHDGYDNSYSYSPSYHEEFILLITKDNFDLKDFAQKLVQCNCI